MRRTNGREKSQRNDVNELDAIHIVSGTTCGIRIECVNVDVE